MTLLFKNTKSLTSIDLLPRLYLAFLVVLMLYITYLVDIDIPYNNPLIITAIICVLGIILTIHLSFLSTVKTIYLGNSGAYIIFIIDRLFREEKELRFSTKGLRIKDGTRSLTLKDSKNTLSLSTQQKGLRRDVLEKIRLLIIAHKV